MDLDKFVSTLIQSELPPQQPFDPGTTASGLDSTQAFSDLYPLLGNEGRTRAVLSAVFWEVITSSDVFRSLLALIGIDDPLQNGGRMIVVMHDPYQNRHDLLILSPQYTGPPVSFPLSRLFTDFVPSWHRFADDFTTWIELRHNEFRYEDQRLLLDVFTRSSSSFVEELASAQPFSIIFASMPTTILTNVAPSPSWGVALEKDLPQNCTIGVVAFDRQGRFGATTCLHGVVSNPDNLSALLKKHGTTFVEGRTVYVNGMPGTIRSADPFTDSCFIEIDQRSAPTHNMTKGPLKGKPPYESEPVLFEGVVSNKKNTVVTGFDSREKMLLSTS
jgi:hypothetical protein